MTQPIRWTFNGLAATPLLLCMATCGCARSAGQKWQPGPPVPLRSFLLFDVQGLYGGQALWVAEDRTAFVQIVGRPPAGHSGLWEKRYRVMLSAEQWAEVERLVGAHPFRDKTRERPGVPDEGPPIIVVVTKAGVTAKSGKWINDKDADFDPLYEYLLSMCHPTEEPVREGAFDRDWRPEGLPRPW